MAGARDAEESDARASSPCRSLSLSLSVSSPQWLTACHPLWFDNQLGCEDFFRVIEI